MKIESYTIHRLLLDLPRPVGDSQIRVDNYWLTALELKASGGHIGVGFELPQGPPTTGLEQLQAQFEYDAWPVLKGANPSTLALRIGRARGENVGIAAMSMAVQTALWDLMAQDLELPLYQVLGGTDPKVRAYGSTLDFPLSDDEFRARLQHFKHLGFRAIKVKVGHPDVAWDLRRLGIVHDVMGKDIDLMVDANEAWSPKEAVLRAHAYRDHGFDIYWMEDPITREDYQGYARLAAELPFVRINTGEYLEFSGKRRLLEQHAVDVLNIQGSINDPRAAAHLAGDYGIPVSLGNTILEIGVHVAASLPDCLYLEFSDLLWNRLAREPVKFEGGYAIAPDRPGHGIELDRDAVKEFSRPA
jgi:L-alanine-DL-glutamate epimerase-like enolase superfamily enzyme